MRPYHNFLFVLTLLGCETPSKPVPTPFLIPPSHHKHELTLPDFCYAPPTVQLSSPLAAPLPSAFALQHVPQRPGGPPAEDPWAPLWDLYSQGHIQEANAAFASWLDEGKEITIEGQRGKVRYWFAKSLFELGRISEANTQLLQIIHEHPLSYYALLAFHFLSAHAPDTITKDGLIALWQNDVGVPLPNVHEWDPQDWEIVRIAIETMKAYDEANLLALFSDHQFTGKSLLPHMVAFAHCGDPARSIRLSRSKADTFWKHYPSKRALVFWQAAFPKLYDKEITSAATRAGIDAHLMRAIAREESSYASKAISSAKAYGIMQLILPTAKRYQEHIDTPVTKELLFDPTVNFTLAAFYLKRLEELMKHHAFMIPSYNAGPGAVRKWQTSNGGMPFDVWLENIPYLETRNYTRRVIQSYLVYTYLYDKQIIALPDFK